MSPIRHTISPAQIDLLAKHLKSFTGETTVYFNVVTHDFPYADYIAEIRKQSDGTYAYMFGGHGIGSNTKAPVSLDATLERVLEHNQLCNNGGDFTYGYLRPTE